MNDITYIQLEKQVKPRVLQATHPFIKRRVESILKMNYCLYIHHEDYFQKTNPIFTIILTIYEANINYIKDSLLSVFSQTYHNTEVVLINNGATGAISELVWKYFTENKNSKLIVTTHNYYDPTKSDEDDPIPNLWNAGLFYSDGDYVYFLSYDDKLSNDYVERMVKLFIYNPNCTTAAPMVNSINENGEINERITQILEQNNVRDRYSNGVSLALSYMKGENKILFPGGLLAVKSELVIQCGGFDNFNDLGQLFKFAIHGDSGFDPQAKLFWRHHSFQANKIQKGLGLVYYKNTRDFLSNYEIVKLHEKIGGKDFSESFLAYWENKSIENTVDSVRDALNYGFSPYIKACVRMIREKAPLICFFKVMIRFPYDLIILIKNIYIIRPLKKLIRNSQKNRE